MRDRIYRYLEQAAGPVPADQILRNALKIYSTNARAADRVLKEIVGRDPRFLRCKTGLWRAAATTIERRGFPPSAVLVIEESPSNQHSVRGALHPPGAEAAWEFRFCAGISDGEPSILVRARSQIQDCVLVAWSGKELRLWNWLLRSQKLEEWVGETIYLRDLAGRVLSLPPMKVRPEDLAHPLGLAPPDAEQPGALARFFASALVSLMELVPEDFRGDAGQLQDWLEAARERVDFSRFAFGPEFLRQIPTSSGVYVMRNRAGDILYVGKARNLKRRIGSYFIPRALRDSKIARIHRLLHSLEFIMTRSEVEALLLEMRLIRDFKPPVNLQDEVHEPRGVYGNEHNLILLVPEPGGEKADAYFLAGGCFAGRQSLALGRSPAKKVREKIQTIYFSTAALKRRTRASWEREIVLRWLKSNKNRVNYVNIDEAGSFESVLRQLGLYLRDPGQLSQKVYYR